MSIPDAAPLHLTTGNDAGGVGEPVDRQSAWRDVIYKGNDNYYIDGDDRPWKSRVGGTLREPRRMSTGRHHCR